RKFMSKASRTRQKKPIRKEIIMRIKYLCILKDKVVEIPVSKIKNGNMIKKELSGETVLKVEMIYETENRKPSKIVNMNFNKITLDKHGDYDVNSTSKSDNLQVKLEYIFSDFSVDEIKALPIPIAPSIPTNEEILIIKTYLDNKYPLLLKNSPRAMEDSIYRMKNIHKKEIETF